MRRRKRKNSKNIIMIIFLVIFVPIASYALLTSDLTVSGSATAPTQTKLDHQVNLYSSPYWTEIVIANPYLSRNAETLTNGGNTITSTYNVTSANNTTKAWQTRFTYTNLNQYTLTTGSYTTSTDCFTVTRAVSLSSTTIAYNSTLTVDVTLTHTTRKARNCSVTTTITYVYNGTTKYLYYIIAFL